PFAEDVCKQGNEAYKASFTQQAAKLAPKDASPLPNISAVYFELGDYDAYHEMCANALPLVGENDTAKQKLYLRTPSNSFDIDQTRLDASLAIYENSGRQISNPKAAHEKIIRELPRYKPQMYNIGQRLHSCLFAGIGDARNLHFYMMDASTDVVEGRIGDKKFPHDSGGQQACRDCPTLSYFRYQLPFRCHTQSAGAVDSIRCRILETLIISLLLDELSKTDTKNRVKNLLLPLYRSNYARTNLHDAASKDPDRNRHARRSHTFARNSLMCQPPFRHDILRLLRERQQPAGAAFATVAFQRRHEKIKRYSMPGNEKLETNPSWKKESAFYELTGIPTVPAAYDTVFDAVMLAYAQYSRNRAAAVDAATSAADASWKTNVTMIDLDWLRVLGNGALGFPNVAKEPWDLARKISDTGLSIELFKVGTQWFLMTSGALRILKGSIKIEACNSRPGANRIRCGWTSDNFQQCNHKWRRGKHALVEYTALYRRHSHLIFPNQSNHSTTNTSPLVHPPSAEGISGLHDRIARNACIAQHTRNGPGAAQHDVGPDADARIPSLAPC
ncbi:putative tetratricopeptide-like protein, partial [Teratosphaeria destructans]